MSEVVEQKPWHQHRMLWLVIGIPLWSVVAGIIFISLALSDANDVVKDNYYKEGLAINQSFAQDAAAKALNLKALVEVKDQTRLVVKLENGFGPFIRLSLYHNADSDFDMHGAMAQIRTDETGSWYQFQLPEYVTGRWFIELTGTDSDSTVADAGPESRQAWRLHKRLDFPLASTAVLTPIDR
jgi:hypothetical protein